MPSKKQILVILVVSLVGGAIIKMALNKFAPSIAAKL
jgi:hypothetical protein